MNLAGILSGDGAEFFGQKMSQYFLPGTVYKQISVYDQYGDVVITDAAYDALMQVDSMTETMRQEQGAADTDRAIYILSTSTTAPIDSDCEILCGDGPYAGQRFQVASVNRDPVAAYWQCRGRRAS